MSIMQFINLKKSPIKYPRRKVTRDRIFKIHYFFYQFPLDYRDKWDYSRETETNTVPRVTASLSSNQILIAV